MFWAHAFHREENLPDNYKNCACLTRCRNQGLWEYHLKKWRALICKLQIIWAHAFYHLEKLPDNFFKNKDKDLSNYFDKKL